ncbi:MAG: hypothetical protein QOH99_163, partial [Frankiaceae bacterium]|nr:hypothetical protein [Frankiaceae bacterium]
SVAEETVNEACTKQASVANADWTTPNG